MTIKIPIGSDAWMPGSNPANGPAMTDMGVGGIA